MNELRVEGELVRGVVALAVTPGTRAKDRDRLVEGAIADRLQALASELGVVVGAAPSAFAWPRDGKDAEGRTIFDVCGRVEGDRLVPHRKGISR